MIVARGYCPKCNCEWSVAEARRHVRVTGVVTIYDAVKIGKGIRCMVCTRLITRDVLEGRTKKPFKRDTQIRLVNDKGEQKYVLYGATHSIKRDLSARKMKLPDGFKGSGTALASKLGISEEDLAAQFGMNVEDLSTARFDVGKSELKKEPKPDDK